MLVNDTFLNMINSPVRQIRARVELLDGSALLDTFSYKDRLISFTVERVGEGKFFGFGICHRLNVKLLDKDRELDITTANTIDIAFGAGYDYMYALPLFKVSEVHRDEKTNELSITAYDALYSAALHTTSEILLAEYDIKTFAIIAAAVCGLNCRFEGLTDEAILNTYYPNGANLEGIETLRDAFNAIAEITQTIYFVNRDWELVFKRLDRDGAAVLTIGKDKYFDFQSRTNRRLATICHTTELGDNISASLLESGSTQYMRDNPFLELREDIDILIDGALSAIGGITINQFSLDWRGNFLAEIGDKLYITSQDGEAVYSFLLDDVITYDGTYKQQTQWSYAENETESASNPTTLGDALKQTYAKVDKANKEIAIVASDVSANKESISTIMLNTDTITATVSKIEETTTSAFESVNSDISTLTEKVEAQITADDVKISIQSELANGVDKVITNTGYTFNDEGLTVERTDSEMKTRISEDGMVVYKNDEAVLTADNIGVNALNLHATTYLIIGNNSRFEDFGGRTGCFWIGG